MILFFVQAYENNLGLVEIHIYNRWISFSIKKKIKKWKERSYFCSLQFINPAKLFSAWCKTLTSDQISSNKRLTKKCLFGKNCLILIFLGGNYVKIIAPLDFHKKKIISILLLFFFLLYIAFNSISSLRETTKWIFNYNKKEKKNETNAKDENPAR